MKGENKTKNQLTNETIELRQQISKLKGSETERTRSGETLLCESEERYRAIIEQSADCIYLADSGTKQRLQANQAFQRLLGYNADEITKLRGYPDGLKGEKIPFGARILHVANSFDSMTADRPHRPSPGKKYAISELKKYSGTQFDTQVAAAFLKILEKPDLHGTVSI